LLKTQRQKRIITIKTPLYEVKFDTRGAEPISWIIRSNKNGGAEIFSVAGKKSDRIPLELISPEGLKRQPREVPLQIQTGDPSLDGTLMAATYRLEGLESNSTATSKSISLQVKRRRWSLLSMTQVAFRLEGSDL
jgi:hypothetical protein